MSPVAVLVLAGGRGSRLGGVAKAGLRLGGRTLLDRTVHRLPAGSPVLIALGPHDDRALALPAGVVTVPDPEPDLGPLGGMLAGAQWLARNRPDIALMQTVPVDSPFLPTELTACLVGALPQHAPAILPAWCGQLAPTHGLWRVGALADVRPAADGRMPGPWRLGEQLGAARFDWPEDGMDDPFASINTLADLLAATRRRRQAEGKFGLGKAGQTR